MQGTRSRTRTYKTYVENCWDVISHGSQQRRYNILKSMYMHPRVCTFCTFNTCVLREREMYRGMRVSCNMRAEAAKDYRVPARELGPYSLCVRASSRLVKNRDRSALPD